MLIVQVARNSNVSNPVPEYRLETPSGVPLYKPHHGGGPPHTLYWTWEEVLKEWDRRHMLVLPKPLPRVRAHASWCKGEEREVGLMAWQRYWLEHSVMGLPVFNGGIRKGKSEVYDKLKVRMSLGEIVLPKEDVKVWSEDEINELLRLSPNVDPYPIGKVRVWPNKVHASPRKNHSIHTCPSQTLVEVRLACNGTWVPAKRLGDHIMILEKCQYTSMVVDSMSLTSFDTWREVDADA